MNYARVTVSVEDIEMLEAVGATLFRNRESDDALKVLALALRFREATGFHAAFRCDIDESAGMAEVVELHGYSRKVPCA